MSYIKIKSDLLKKYCEHTIKGIEERRAEKDQKWDQKIDAEVEKSLIKQWYHKLFNIEPKCTREEVISDWFANDWDFMFSYPSNIGETNIEVAERLFKMANEDDEVLVSSADYRYLWTNIND